MDLKIARGLITLPAAFLVVVPPIADLNASHVGHPLWTPHARLHTVWLLSTNCLVALIALIHLWSANPLKATRLRHALWLTATILAGFFIATATRSLYGGALSDETGIEATFAGLNPNLVAFSVLSLLLGAAAIGLRGRGDD